MLFENELGKTPASEIKSVIIYDGVYVERYRFKGGEVIHKEKLNAATFQLENALKLKTKDKNLLLGQLKRDLKFLVKMEAVKYQIHFTFRKNDRKFGNVFLQKTTSLQVGQEEKREVNPMEAREMRFSVASSYVGEQSLASRYIPNRFETFLEDHICQVSIQNYCQFSRESEIEDISLGRNQVFSINNPEVY